MIKPTIGGDVWYHPDNPTPTAQPWAALVCFVHSDTMVNLVVFDENGYGKPKSSVHLWQGGEEGSIPPTPYCEWMPFQIGQAKAQEAK